MDIHILDYIMWFVVIAIVWNVMEHASNRELTEELGGCIGLLIIMAVTVVHIILFGYVDYNWIDIFRSVGEFIKKVNVDL